jgi:hypothetical protein
MAFSIPASVSQILGGGFPWQGRAESPFTEMAPSFPSGRNSANSRP